MENFGGDKFFKVRLYLCSPLDSHNKYPIKTFLSKHSLLASIHQKFLKPQFFLIHMLRLLDKNSAHLIFCKLLQLRIIPRLRSKFPKVKRNQASSIFFFYQRNRRTISSQPTSTPPAPTRRVLDFNGRRWKGNFTLFICRLTRAEDTHVGGYMDDDSIREHVLGPLPPLSWRQAFEIHGISRGPC